MQISSSSHNAAQKRVAQLLREKASEINSRVLSALAVKVEEDPFVKVKKMIKDLIVRLMEEANEEAEHKGWCDTELGTNEQTRKEARDRDKKHRSFCRFDPMLTCHPEPVLHITRCYSFLG